MKKTARDYAIKIVEVAYYNVIPDEKNILISDKETVISVTEALLKEFSEIESKKFALFISKLEPQINPDCFDLVTNNYYRIKSHDDLYDIYQKTVSK